MAKRKTTGLPKKKKDQPAANAEAATQESQVTSEGGILTRLLGSEYETRAEREKRIQRLIVTTIGVLVGVLLVLIVVGVLWESVIVPGQTVATVNGEKISVAEFEDRVRLERLIINQRFYNDIPFLQNLGLLPDVNQILQQEPYSTYWSEITGQPEVLGSRVLDEMIEEEIVRAKAAELGVTADDAAVEEQVETFFNLIAVTEEPTEEVTETVVPSDTPTPYVSPTPSPEPTATATATATATPTPLVTEEASGTEEANGTGTEEPAEPSPTPRPTDPPSPTPSNDDRRANFQDALDLFYTDGRAVDLNRETVRSYFEYDALISALRDEVTQDVERAAPYVNARHILVATEEEAQQVMTALEEGESFADLARAVSTDTGSGARGGELGWSPATNYVAEFRDAVTEAEIGAVVGPVQSQFGYHIIQVRAREERELSDNEFEQAKNAVFNTWLEEVTNEENNEVVRNDNWIAHVPTNPVFEPLRVVDPADAS
jgi:peptidyl-prolyl cis-trans isomerase D